MLLLAFVLSCSYFRSSSFLFRCQLCNGVLQVVVLYPKPKEWKKNSAVTGVRIAWLSDVEADVLDDIMLSCSSLANGQLPYVCLVFKKLISVRNPHLVSLHGQFCIQLLHFNILTLAIMIATVMYGPFCMKYYANPGGY